MIYTILPMDPPPINTHHKTTIATHFHSLPLTNSPLTRTPTTMAEKQFKPALIVVDFQEDFCPPVRPPPPQHQSAL